MKFAEKFRKFLEKLQNYPEQKKKIILWTVVVMVGLPMLFFWISGALNSFSKLSNSIQIPDISTNNVPSIDISQITADWKTYTNEKYGFEFKYPDIFKEGVISIKAESVVLFYSKSSENLELRADFIDNFDPKSLVKNDEKNITYNKSVISVDGLASYKVDSVTCYMGCASGYSIFIPYKNSAISVKVIRGDGSYKEPNLVKITNEEKANFDQIISTFKFTK